MAAVAVGAVRSVGHAVGQSHAVQAGCVFLDGIIVTVGTGRSGQLLCMAIVRVGVAFYAVHAFVDRSFYQFRVDEDGGAFFVLCFAHQLGIGMAVHADFVVGRQCRRQTE